VKPGEEVVSVNVGWTVEKFVAEEKKEKPKASKSAPAKKAKAPAKTNAPKGKPTAKAKPAKKKKK
jgi:hypothetical protein